jgi:hypothetical protein
LKAKPEKQKNVKCGRKQVGVELASDALESHDVARAGVVPHTRTAFRPAPDSGLLFPTQLAIPFLANNMGYELGSPVNTTLMLLIAYVASKILFPSVPEHSDEKPPSDYKLAYNWLPAQHPLSVVYKDYTPKTLQPFNGVDHERILLAINGIVYDVTAGKSFYGPGETLPPNTINGLLINGC